MCGAIEGTVIYVRIWRTFVYDATKIFEKSVSQQTWKTWNSIMGWTFVYDATKIFEKFALLRSYMTLKSIDFQQWFSCIWTWNWHIFIVFPLQKWIQTSKIPKFSRCAPDKRKIPQKVLKRWSRNENPLNNACTFIYDET